MSVSLSFNHRTMMDYLHADIHAKAPSNGENGGEGCYVQIVHMFGPFGSNAYKIMFLAFF